MRRLPSAMPTPTLDIVVPVYNEEADLGPSRAPAACGISRESVPFSARITIADNASTDATLQVAHGSAAEIDGVRGAAPRREGSRPRTARGVAGLGRDGRRLHGRRPVHGSQRPDAARRAAAVRSLGPRHRLPPARSSRVVRGPSGSSSPAATTCCCEASLRARLLRRPVRVQGDARRRRARTAAAGRGRRMVLRHRIAGASPNARACASTRCRSIGSTTRTAASTSSTPPRKDLLGHLAAGSGAGHRLAADRAACASSLGREPLVPGCRAAWSVSWLRFGVVGVASAPPPTRCSTSSCIRRSARRPRISWRCCSPRCSTPPPTARSPSACAARRAPRGTRSRV